MPASGAVELAPDPPAGSVLPPPAPGPPRVRPGQDVGEALASVLGQLTEAMLHWAAHIGAAPEPEAVHQMRVATRRLRSAVSVFKVAVPAVEAFSAPAKHCAAQLGAVRDWDVFLAGTGAALQTAFPGDAGCAALLRAAGRARRDASAGLRDYLAGTEFQATTTQLAAASLTPLVGNASDRPVATFGAEILARRFRHVRRRGHHIGQLPAAELHELRKECKRLRYTAEFFAPLYSGKPMRRFVRRLSALQDELGLLNDGATVARLLAGLGRSGRGHAAGLALGMAAGQAGAARERIGRAWTRVRTADPFWTD